MTNEELQSTIASAVAGGVDHERAIVRTVQASVYVTEARVRHHLHKLRSTRMWPGCVAVRCVLRYIPRMDHRVGEGIYEVM